MRSARRTRWGSSTAISSRRTSSSASGPGDGTIIKVLDFGIAKSIESTDTDPSLTTSQNVVGSPVYMSPEQLRASKHVDERTDIWSLGVIMFELLSGKVPFVGDSVLELGMRIMTVPAPSLVELRAEVPSALADVVQRCLEKEPEKRYPTVDVLASALKPFVDISHRSLPFADTLDESSSRSPFSGIDPRRTGGEFVGTNGGASATRSSRAARTWGVLALLAAGIAVVAVLVHHTEPRPPAPAAAPATFRVAPRISPTTAHVRFDGEPASAPPFVRDVPRDGRRHTLRVEAEGFEPLELSFRDAPPPEDVALKAVSPPPSPPPVASEVVSPTASLPRKDPRPKPATAAVPASAPPPPAAPAPTASVPSKTTNDSPIVR